MDKKEFPRIEYDGNIGTTTIQMNRWFNFTLTVTDHELHIWGDDEIEVLPQGNNHIAIRRRLRMGLNK